MDNLSSMCDLILENIKSDIYVPMDMRELTDFLQIEQGQYDLFSEAIDTLMSSGEICFTKKGKIISSVASGYIIGTFRQSSKSFGFVLNEKGDIYIKKENTIGAINGDKVMVSLLSKSNNGNSREGQIIKILEHTVTEIVGTFNVINVSSPKFKVGNKKQKKIPSKHLGVKYIVQPDDPKLRFNVEIPHSRSNGAKNGQKVAVFLTEYPKKSSDNPVGKVIKIFGETKSKDANYKSILFENGIKQRFNEETLLEAKAIKTHCDVGNRLDLRNKIIFTIDGEGAKDFDDAISIERDGNGYILGVHIADVSHYVKEKSALDKEAMQRGNSVYFTDKVIPMLPEELSNGVCSLNRDSDKYTLSAFINLDCDGNIRSYEFKESIISSCMRGVYHEINDVIDNGNKSEYYSKYDFLFENTIPTMLELYEKLYKKTKERGSPELETTESEIILDDDGYPVDIVCRIRGTSERMIEQFMLAANQAAAMFLNSMSLPCVFRIHEEPTAEKVQAFAEFIYNLGLNVLPLRRKKLLPSNYRDVAIEASEKGLSQVVTPIMLRSMMKAKYSTAAEGHFGLACELYCHFTSPIRRYADLAVHRIIKTAINGELTSNRISRFEAYAKKAADAANEAELRTLNAERDIEDLYKAIFMSDKIGMIFDGIISSIQSFGMFAELENTCEGLIPISTLPGWYEYDEASRSLYSENGKRFSLGQRIKIKVEKSDVISKKIEFSLVDKG